MKQKILTDLHPYSYEHLFDRKTLDILQKTKGLDFIVKKYFEIGMEKIIKIQYTGSNIRVNENSIGNLHQILKNVCEIMFLPKMPDLYVSREAPIKGYTTGVKNPLIVLNSDCVDMFDEKELMYLIGHEVGHIKSSHVLYHTIDEYLPSIGNVIGQSTLGIGNVVAMGLRLALLNWRQMSDFTSDRAGLLSCQDLDSAISVTLKMAGMPKSCYNKICVDEFIKQAQEFENFDYDNANKIAKILSIMDNNHPWTVIRTSELLKWVKSGEYDKILSGDYITCSKVNFHCPICGTKANEKMNFCAKCGHSLNEET